MRLVLAITVLAASASSAHAAEDRYGPRQAAAPVAVATSATARPYAGSMLGWSGKSAAPAPQAERPTAPVRPALMSGGLYRPSSPPQAPVAAAPPAPAPAGYASTAPTSLYSRPSSQTPVDRLPPPPSPTTVQGGLYASSGPRFYSVHRPFGETPDPIPAVPAGERLAYRPEASLAGEVALSGVGDGVRDPDASDDGMAGVGAADAQEEAERKAKRDAERAAARRAAASGGGQ